MGVGINVKGEEIKKRVFGNGTVCVGGGGRGLA